MLLDNELDEVDLFTRAEIAAEIKLSHQLVNNRFWRLAIKPYRKVGHKDYYTSEQIELINYPIHTKAKSATAACYPKEVEHQLEVVELFLASRNNSSPVIAEKLGIRTSTVNHCMDKYFKYGCVVKESKMNESN